MSYEGACMSKVRAYIQQGAKYIHILKNSGGLMD